MIDNPYLYHKGLRKYNQPASKQAYTADQSFHTAPLASKKIHIESRGELLKVSFVEIAALETVNRKVAVYLLDKTIYHTGKLNELSDQLPKIYLYAAIRASP